MPERTVLYIDNSNIFRGCKKSGWRPSYKRVKQYLELEEGPIANAHFFASEQQVPREKQARFYNALRHELGFQLHTFNLAHRKVVCPQCGHEEWVPAEKGVDVGLAIQMLRDLRHDRFDSAVVMSSDRDFFEAIEEVKQAGKRVKVLAWKWTLPPELIRACRERHISILFLEDLQPQLQKPEGDIL